MNLPHRVWDRALSARAVAIALVAGVLGAVGPSISAQQPPIGNPAVHEESSSEARKLFDAAVALQIEAEKGGEDALPRQRRAAALYRKVLALRPQSAPALYNLGRAERAMGNATQAAKHFELAAEIQGPKRVFYLQQWADFLRDTQQWDEAMKAYTEVVRLEPRLDDPHRILKEYYLGLRVQQPQLLLDYLWTLVDSRQPSRSADLALTALEEGWPSRDQLLTVVAASLAQMSQTPKELLESTLVDRLRKFLAEPQLGPGISQLLALYEKPGNYNEPFAWWNVLDVEPTSPHSIPRHAAFRAVLHSIGDTYRLRDQPETAVACYRASIDLADDPDPRALRTLANIYVENNDLPALDALATEYANPEGRIFAAKNEAYRLGQLDRILDYHRALGQIYGSLAAGGKASWGSTDNPTTALFQLKRAYETALQLDANPSTPDQPIRVDPSLTLLYAQGLDATGQTTEAKRVRAKAADHFQAHGDLRSTEKILLSIPKDNLTPDQVRDLDRYRIETNRLDCPN